MNRRCKLFRFYNGLPCQTRPNSAGPCETRLISRGSARPGLNGFAHRDNDVEVI